ncbi:MAG: 2-dehydro-3-deoxygluconokinase [Desulforhopalus sp.]|jgi:2-dehydro-3-deoxygluconokinase
MSFSTALIGECMIELQEVEPGVTKQTFGGDTLNTAMYMARLSRYFPVKVDYVTALGVDNFSDKMVAFWEAEGVGSDLVLRQEGESPGLYYIQLDEDGERHFSYWRSEAAAKKCFEYEKSEELLARLGDYDAVYLSGISIAILTATSRARLYDRLAQLAESKTKIYFDYNYRPHLWKTAAEGIQAYEAILSWCDTVFVGLDELAAIHGVTTTEAGHKFLADKGVRESVIRSGAEPCSIQVGGQRFEVTPEKVTKVVDTTAAGDSFSGAYLLARNSGCSVEKAARIAHRMAAYVIGHKGAVAPLNAMPDFEIS